MTDAVIASIAEVAGPRGVRAFEWVNGAVGVEMAAPLVSGKGIAEETNVEDTEKAGKGGGEGLEVVMQEVGRGAEVGGAGKEMVVEIRAVLARCGLGGEGRTPNKAFVDQNALDVFRLQGVEWGRAVPVQKQRAKKFHGSEHDVFGENRGVLPDPPDGGLHTAIKLPGQIGVGFELEKNSRFEEAGHVGDPGVEDRRLKAAGRSGNDKLTVGPSSAVEGSGVDFDKSGNFSVERERDDVELINVREEGENEDIDNDDTSLDVDFAESAGIELKFGAKLAHGFGVGEVGGGAPPNGDPKVSVNIDDFDERPNGGFDESERVGEVGMTGGRRW